MIVTADLARSAKKVGRAAAMRIVSLEAGQYAQNMILQAHAMDTRAVPVYRFDRRAVGLLLKLPKNLVPLVIISIGGRG